MDTITWFVMGASSGLGEHLTKALQASNNEIYRFNIIACSRSIEELETENYLSVRCDITNIDDIKNALNKGLEKFKKIDVAINHAGTSTISTVEECDTETFRKVFEVNFWGTYYFTKVFLEYFRSYYKLYKKKGRLLSHTSASGLSPKYYGVTYNSTKYATEALLSNAWLESVSFLELMTIECGFFTGTNIQSKHNEFVTRFPEYKLDFLRECNKYRYTSLLLSSLPPYVLFPRSKNSIEKAIEIIIKLTSDTSKTLPRRLMLGRDACIRVSTEVNHIIGDLYNSVRFIDDFR